VSNLPFRQRRNLENSSTTHEDEIESLSKELKATKLLIEESDKKYEEVRMAHDQSHGEYLAPN